MIRPFQIADYESVCKLLQDNKVNPPAEITDLNGICLVSEKDKEINGVIWALIGNGTQAYVGYYAVKKEVQKTRIATDLISHLETIMRLHGVKRYTLIIEKWNKEFETLALHYGCRKQPETTLFWRHL